MLGAKGAHCSIEQAIILSTWLRLRVSGMVVAEAQEEDGLEGEFWSPDVHGAGVWWNWDENN